jgi:integrase/recombinase XerD
MGNSTIRKALEDYKAIYMAYRNFADRTREEYQNDLEQFITFLEKSGITQVKEIGLSIVERYVADLEQKGFVSLTRKRKVVTIRSFLSFLYQDGYIETDIAKKVVLPFTETTTPYVLTQAECDRLRNACTGSARDTAIIELSAVSPLTTQPLYRQQL